MAGLGILIGFMGSDPQTGTLRWTLDTLYLWDGVPLVTVAFGVIVLPEITTFFSRLAVTVGLPAEGAEKAIVPHLAGIDAAFTIMLMAMLVCLWRCLAG